VATVASPGNRGCAASKEEGTMHGETQDQDPREELQALPEDAKPLLVNGHVRVALAHFPGSGANLVIGLAGVSGFSRT
jgi:hypothetical protein